MKVHPLGLGLAECRIIFGNQGLGMNLTLIMATRLLGYEMLNFVTTL